MRSIKFDPLCCIDVLVFLTHPFAPTGSPQVTSVLSTPTSVKKREKKTAFYTSLHIMKCDNVFIFKNVFLIIFFNKGHILAMGFFFYATRCNVKLIMRLAHNGEVELVINDNSRHKYEGWAF